ncbi:MAG: hypothetical protein LBT76_02615, partial [Tannerella sp.]|nr:hypothetical protein [Tannerella sp.]
YADLYRIERHYRINNNIFLFLGNHAAKIQHFWRNIILECTIPRPAGFAIRIASPGRISELLSGLVAICVETGNAPSLQFAWQSRFHNHLNS